MKKSFCEYCMKENEYKIEKVDKVSILNEEEIIYKANETICIECGNEIFVTEIYDYNLKLLQEEYKKKHNIVSVNIIKRIIAKYYIDERTLSLLLGWGIDSVNRYLEGDIPANSHSDILEKIYNNPNYYSIILQTNKDRINAVAYNISRQAVKEILNNNISEEKMDAVIKYLLIRCEDFTPSMLYKLLYYVQGFYYIFTDKFIFTEDCEAGTNGPIYKSIWDRYNKIGFEETNQDILENRKLKIDDVERNVVESIIKFYGCYSGKILTQMTQNEAPWILTRANVMYKDALDDDNSNNIIDKNSIAEYFKGIKEKYNMVNLLDIQKYSTDLFNNISM